MFASNDGDRPLDKLTARLLESPIDSLTSHGNTLSPLAVDLDGTLTPTDTLIESVVQTVQCNPWDMLRLPFWLMEGCAGLDHGIGHFMLFEVVRQGRCEIDI